MIIKFYKIYKKYMIGLLTPLIFLLLSKSIANSLPVNCKEAIMQFSNYECLEDGNPPKIDQMIEEYQYMTIKIKDRDEYRTLRIQKTVSTKETDIPELIYLQQAKGTPNVVNLFDHKITQQFTYFIIDPIPSISVMDISNYPECLKGHRNVLIFIQKLLNTMYKLISNNILNASIMDRTLRITEQCDPLITDFTYAVLLDTRMVPPNLHNMREPLVVRAQINSRSLRYTEKIDVWCISELLYFMTHEDFPFNLLTIKETVQKNTELKLHINSGIPVEIATILNIGLMKDIINRANIGHLILAIENALVVTSFSILQQSMIVDMDGSLTYGFHSFKAMFSELLFVIFLVFFAIPLTVCIISAKVKADEIREANQPEEQDEEVVNRN